MYRRAMACCGASTAGIDAFVNALRDGQPLPAVLASAPLAPCDRLFVGRTFAFIEEEGLCAIASAFTFGREDLLPAVFQRIVDELNVTAGGGLDLFKYYLNRHIGIDGDEHGPMANRLMQSLCGADENSWKIAEQAAVQALEARRALWDGIYALMRRRKEAGALPSARS